MSVPVRYPTLCANWPSAGWHFYYPKKSRYRVAVEATQWNLVPQELQQARDKIPIKRESGFFSLNFNFLVPKANIDATTITVTTKFTAVRVHMNSVLEAIINSSKS
ncbi:uncharacterized protein TNCV_3583191 [Trichonephila clavipes]|nr:uncharacterized protein TNCV_3583191 [Trichonephila clavipes]